MNRIKKNVSSNLTALPASPKANQMLELLLAHFLSHTSVENVRGTPPSPFQKEKNNNDDKSIKFSDQIIAVNNN